MARKRLSDSAALTQAPASGEDHSISVRAIDNGYLVRTSTYNSRTGDCRSSEKFSATPPKVVPPKVGRGEPVPAGGESLRGAMDFLKG